MVPVWTFQGLRTWAGLDYKWMEDLVSPFFLLFYFCFHLLMQALPCAFASKINKLLAPREEKIMVLVSKTVKAQDKRKSQTYSVRVEKGLLRTSVFGSEWRLFLTQHGLVSGDQVNFCFDQRSDRICAFGLRYKDRCVDHRVGNLITCTQQILQLLSFK